MSWPEPPPPPPASWGASSIASEATPENLASGSEELTAQQAKMMEATTKLLAVVSEVGGGPWEASPGLTEGILTVWMGEQEDRVDDLKERIDRKQGEMARLVEVAEADLLGPVGAELVPGQALPHFETSVRFNQGQDLSQVGERHPLGRLHNGEGERLQRLQNSRRTKGPADGQVRTSTPADGGDRVSRAGVDSFLRLSGQEEEDLDE